MAKHCCTCGYLARQDVLSGETVEALQPARERGMYLEPPGREKIARLYCYAISESFPAKPGMLHEEFISLIKDENSCPMWTQYLQGRTAQEHMRLQELQDQRAHNAEMLNAELPFGFASILH